MKSSVSVCPVPFEQQPLNEYQALRESWFFSWATRDLSGYIKPLIILWIISWFVVGPVSAASFPLEKAPLKFWLVGIAAAWLLPTLTLTRLYLGWRYVRDRLQNETISYEESGWYDGQTWTKPESVLQRDRLLVSYEIRPILRRMVKTLLGVLLFVALVSSLVWVIL